jgi:hypothetical protein
MVALILLLLAALLAVCLTTGGAGIYQFLEDKQPEEAQEQEN